MATDKNRKSTSKGDGRDGGGFIALPWSVLDSASFLALSHPAKALLLEFARQHHFHRSEGAHTNGRLLANSKTLAKRGWKSSDTLTRAKRELIKAGFLYETVKGCRPNKASWYALTWFTLPMRPNYDAGAMNGFIKSAFLVNTPLKIKALIPSGGIGISQAALSHGIGRLSTMPPHGSIKTKFDPLSTPSIGNHIRGLPSTRQSNKQVINFNELQQG